MVGIVYVALDGNVSQILTVKVKKGDTVSAIQKKIKEKVSNIFALYDPAQIEVFQSNVQSGNKLEADDTPLDGRKKWDSKVTWGSEELPLIVYSPRNDITRATQIATADTAAMDSFVYYRLIINEKPRRVTTFKVKEGEYIDSIIRGIKLQESPDLDSIPASRIELFESIESAEPLHALTKWNTDVTWGKPETPLIVQVQPLAVAPGNNSEVLEIYKPALEFAKQQLEAKTEEVRMSTASNNFANLLLSGMGINISVDESNIECGSIGDPLPYSWTVETTSNEIVKKGELQGTPGATKWLRENFIGIGKTVDGNEPNKPTFSLKDVTGKNLPPLTANKMIATGRGDLVIGKTEVLEVPVSDPHEHAYGLIELKTDKSNFRRAQNVLELTALSQVSRIGRKVALLASDCGKKWELYYFKSYNTIVRRGYKHGRKCWEDFMKILDDADTRELELEPPTSRFKPTLSDCEEDNTDDQNLVGFDIEEDSKSKAVERQAMLENLANQLAVLYDEKRPIVPYWARAEATCPEYYS